MQGIPLSQIFEIHRHVQTLRRVFPRLDPQARLESGQLHPDTLRLTIANTADADLVEVARALAAIIGCNRIIGTVEVPCVVDGRITRQSLGLIAEQT